MRMPSIASLIQRQVTILHSDQPIREAARAMCDREIGCVLISDRHHDLVGIVTDRDIACSVAAAGVSAEDPIAEIMSADPASVEETDDIEFLLRKMEQAGVRRIPVVKKLESGVRKCVGIITLDDLLVSSAITPHKASRVIAAQMRGRNLSEFERMRDEIALRRQDHRGQRSLNHFYQTVEKKTNLSADKLGDVTHFLLGALLRRLPYPEAGALLAQIPKGLRDDLLEIPPGPDVSITLSSILGQLCTRYGFDEPSARSLLFRFFAALEELVDETVLERAKAQLPEDLRRLIAENRAA